MTLALPISREQLNKHNELCKRFNAEVDFPVGFRVVPQDEAEPIAAYYGNLYICILPDGSSHS